MVAEFDVSIADGMAKHVLWHVSRSHMGDPGEYFMVEVVEALRVQSVENASG